MRNKFWMSLLLAISVGLSGVARAQGHGHDKHDRDDDDDRGQHYYSDHDRDAMRNWYHDRDRDDHLPPGLRKKMMPCPEEVERRLPPPPVGCEHVVIGGHVVLVNRSTYVVMDIIHFEL